MTPSEIRAKETKELLKIVQEKRTAMFGLKLQKVTGQLTKMADIGKARKDIARMLTIARERELGIRAGEKTNDKEQMTKGREEMINDKKKKTGTMTNDKKKKAGKMINDKKKKKAEK